MIPTQLQEHIELSLLELQKTSGYLIPIRKSKGRGAAARQEDIMISGYCRFCGSNLHATFVDLGMSPLANSYLTPAQLHQMEPFYPLRVYVCGSCLLVQAEEFESPESIFGDYAYFASYSDTWLQHTKTYADMAVQRFGLGKQSLVIEIASNDGYLLQHFVAKG